MPTDQPSPGEETGSEQEPQWPGLFAFGMSGKQAQYSCQKEQAEDKQVGEQCRLRMKGEESRMSAHQKRGPHQESARRALVLTSFVPTLENSVPAMVIGVLFRQHDVEGFLVIHSSTHNDSERVPHLRIFLQEGSNSTSVATAHSFVAS